MSIEAWSKLTKSQQGFVVATLGEAITSVAPQESAYPPDFGSSLFSKKDSLAPFHIAISALKELSEKQCE